MLDLVFTPLGETLLRGARRIRPPVRRSVPSWDLQVVLDGLSGPQFEPIHLAEIDFVLQDSNLFGLGLS